MAYNEFLEERVEQVLLSKQVSFEKKKMMGGLCFLIDAKMCVGIVKEELMVRIHPEKCEDLLQTKSCRPMDFTGRPMKGYLFVSPEGVDLAEDLEFWVDLCLEFNPFAKSSKKK